VNLKISSQEKSSSDKLDACEKIVDWQKKKNVLTGLINKKAVTG
jgi:hypothetical protein